MVQCRAVQCSAVLWYSGIMIAKSASIMTSGPSSPDKDGCPFLGITVQYSALQYRTVQYSTVQCSTVQYNTRSYHTLVVDVYARCYIYRSRTEIFIICVCPTGSISLAERIYGTRSKIFISWVGGRPVVYHEWSAANTSDIQQVNPLPS